MPGPSRAGRSRRVSPNRATPNARAICGSASAGASPRSAANSASRPFSRSVAMPPGLIALTRTPSPTPPIGERLRQVEQCRVDGPADGELGRSRPAADADDVDDGAAGGAQVRPCGATQTHRRKELQSETVVPLVVREGEEIPANGRPRVVDQYVELPELRDGGVDHTGAGIGTLADRRRARDSVRRVAPPVPPAAAATAQRPRAACPRQPAYSQSHGRCPCSHR